MKRKVEREKKIPAFSVEIGDLEALWERLVALFESKENVYGSIDITLPNEELEFRSIEELRQYSALKGKITKFRIYLSHNERTISIRTSNLFYSLATVTAKGDTEAWCAGATETVYSFLHSYKVWYHWFASAPIGWILLIMANVPLLALMTIAKVATNKIVYIGWLSTIVALAVLWAFRGKLFPSTVIYITREESFIRRHSAELGLVIAILSVILTIIGWFIKSA